MEREMDLIKPGLSILFTGFNPSIQSGRTGHHYANPTNRFWKILFLSGLTDRLYRPEEDRSLLSKGYGFTNIVHRPTKDAAEITKEEYAEGRDELIEKIGTYRPKAVCFVGKGVYLQYRGQKKAPWGFQDKRLYKDVQEFAAPSSSGLVRIKLDEMVSIYQILAAAIEKRD
ncbi:G/U mismatch-specific DNA glycosylase [Bacillus mangrovi]|uniref:G/U mismatch-specific DNA glycosylase n=1 Tax=Metabacillus mangrovi TaxID=1491830 RepID=A0A7X2S1R9_9BACI|nr:G/U mismatch-specific DNA glycosylase [Metabacillus mangrovi]MTH52010.1 G/U mismatch-specific DNA glycosylase [Metabacillus mangrovi]